MNREEAHKHKKRKSSGGLFVGGIFVAVCVSVLIAFLFALGGALASEFELFMYNDYFGIGLPLNQSSTFFLPMFDMGIFGDDFQKK